MYRRLSLALAFIFALAPPAMAERRLDLPVTIKTLAFTYLYCLTDDTAATTDLLDQRLRYIGETEKNARALAEGMMAEGYCRSFMNVVAENAPEMRQRVTRKLVNSGFTIQRPITEQVAESGTESKSKIGKAIKTIGRFLSKVFSGRDKEDGDEKEPEGGTEGGGAGGNVSLKVTRHCIKTKTKSADGTVTKTKVCESFTDFELNVSTGPSPFDPTPYNPSVPGQ